MAFCGQYRGGSRRGGVREPVITYGYSKDHRPDLKQLLLILTTAADGGVPVQFRVADGNTNDTVTHIETWHTLRDVAGRADLLYVGDSRLCTHDNLDHIHRGGGRIVTVMPRSRREDAQFREWLQTHTREWALVWDRPPSRQADGPRDRWWVCQDPLPSTEGWPVIWVWSTVLTLRRQASRHRRLAAAVEALTGLRERLANPAAGYGAPLRSISRPSGSFASTE